MGVGRTGFQTFKEIRVTTSLTIRLYVGGDRGAWCGAIAPVHRHALVAELTVERQKLYYALADQDACRYPCEDSCTHTSAR